MMLGDELNLGDLLEMQKLEKPRQSGVKLLVGEEILESGGLSSVAEKMENNEDIKRNEISRTIDEVVGGINKMKVDYFGDLISVEKYEGIPEDNDDVCEVVMEHGLTLYSMTYLPLKVAKVLLNKGGDLFLAELPEISEDLAELMGQHNGGLGLSGLTEINDKIAEHLSSHRGYLDLSHVKKISDYSAVQLGKHQGVVDLGLTELSVEVAKELRKCRGGLCLGSLSELTGKAAEELSKREDYLSLRGLKKLSDNAAKSLINHKGDLYLEGLEEISDTALKYLVRHQGPVVLSEGLKGKYGDYMHKYGRNEGKLTFLKSILKKFI